MPDKHIRKALRETAFKAFLKRTLIFLMAGLVVGIMLWFYYDYQNKYTLPPQKNITVADIEEKKLYNPKYVSQDSQNRPYVITAQEAKEGKDGILTLRHLKGELQLNNETIISLKAEDATVENQSLKKAHLENNVIFAYGHEMVLTTQSADIDFNEGTVQGPLLLTGQGTRGSVKGDRFAITDQWKKISLLGNAEVILND